MAYTYSPSPRTVPGPRFSLGALFFLNGAVLSSWAPRIPAVKANLELSEPMLGIALFGIAAGSVPSLLATGLLLRRTPVHRVCLVSSALFAGTLPLIGAAGGLVTLTAALVAIGASSGALDVAMNTAAAGMERHEGRRLMSGFHGAYSGGVLSGAGAGGLAAAASVPVALHFAIVTVVLLVLLGVVGRGVPGSTAPVPTSPTTAPTGIDVGDPAPSTPTTGGAGVIPLLMLVPVAIAALLLEGVVTDWSAVLAAAPPFESGAVSAAVVAVFSAAMMVSRAGVGPVLSRYGERRVVVVCSVVLVAVLPVTVLQSEPVVLLLGLLVSGLAIGPLFPMVMSAAGARTRHDPATSTARVTACGYLAYLAGPPLVGLLAGGAGLAVAIAATAAAATLVLLLLGRVALDRGARTDRARPRRAQQRHRTTCAPD